ncbi:CocE/NonD family hydrolase [Phenylobacterium soli]|uniref:Xaa-Pro dipeptidyl-peptidase C-terminal domain-containing protein n=1 Tax=Phenylobacterium soli TaxID=2170551 RepID=A0A328ACM9_9CAUL|nr:CocE/NonD family hydrolase [Phenylobacterium soli]RAK51966.1 hypothetical protein DJ017_18260 [Phenylobacterium soli]
MTASPAARTLAALLALAPGATAAGAPAKVSRPGVYQGYAQATYDGAERSSFYIPMRDGVRLAADLFRPTTGGKLAAERLPVIWMHTPYNRRDYRGQPTVERYPGYAMQLVKYGYNVAVVDFRGLYASEGRNVGYNRGEWRGAARTDAYDVTEWFARQPWSSGRIGMWGCSATGGSQMQAATTRPPSLKAIMPMSAEFDAYPFVQLGGVQSPPRSTASAAQANAERDAQAAPVDGADGAAELKAAVAGHARNVEQVGSAPFRDSIAPGVGEAWWMRSSPSTYLAALRNGEFGVYAVANWEEAGTRHGAFRTFRNLPNTKLLVGPGTHCDWSGVKADTGFDITIEELRFFDHWLKGVDNGVMREPRVTYYTYNRPADAPWRTAASWPPREAVAQTFRLGAGALDKGLQGESAAGEDHALTAAPAPSSSTFIETPAGGLSYETAPLAADLEITGDPLLRLWVSTEGSDVDVLATLEDVAPDGAAVTRQMVGRLRASHRALAPAPYDNLGLPWHSHRQADARPMPRGEPQELAFDLLPMSYLFKAGHRVRLRLTFADPQGRVGLPVSVHRGGETASFISLPVAAR